MTLGTSSVRVWLDVDVEEAVVDGEVRAMTFILLTRTGCGEVPKRQD